MDSRIYFESIVKPLSDECVASGYKIHLILPSIIMLYHVADYLAAGRGGTVKKEILERIIEEFPEFSFVQSIANVTKHFELDRGGQKGMSARAIVKGKGLPALLGERFMLIGGMPAIIKTPLSITIDDKRINLEALLAKTLGYFEKNIAALADEFEFT